MQSREQGRMKRQFWSCFNPTTDSDGYNARPFKLAPGFPLFWLKKIQDFPGPHKHFPGPYHTPAIFKYRQKTEVTNH